ncbi:MAG TPA: T9SS type A sorting domain-containing protein [Bacteroidia bacterium]|nr:T9SS type A sorting domain-containing protein [Bacteroidia bacterium]
MRVKSSILVFLCILLINISRAQTKFQTTFGDSLSEYCFSVKQTNDHGFVLAGYTNSYGSGGNNFYIIKTDSLSNIIWSKIYGGALDDEAYAIQQTSDGGYITTGYTRSFGIQYYDACLLKTDVNGDTLWTKTYGGPASDFGNTVAQTIDGGYILAGYTTDTTSLFLIKTNAQGNMLWQKVLETGGQVTDAYSIKQTANKSYVITGYGNGFGEINGDAFLLKTDSAGNTLFTKTYGYKGPDWGNAIYETTDGGFVIGGSYSTDSTGNDIDVYVIKTNANGDTLWTKTFGGTGNDYGQAIQQTTDGGYILAGYTNSFGMGNYDAFLLKLNPNGDTLWAKTFGGTGDDEANTAMQTTDGGYILAGQSNSFGKGNYDFYVIKTDANGNSNCNQTNVVLNKRITNTTVTNASMLPIAYNVTTLPAAPTIYNGATLTDACNPLGIADLKANQASLKVFPNPTNGLFTVSIAELKQEKATVFIQNILGETIYAMDIVTDKEINLQYIANGTYFLQVQTADRIYTEKIIVTK